MRDKDRQRHTTMNDQPQGENPEMDPAWRELYVRKLYGCDDLGFIELNCGSWVCGNCLAETDQYHYAEFKASTGHLICPTCKRVKR